MIKKFNIFYLLILTIVMSLTSCNGDLDGDSGSLSACFDIAIYGGSTDDGTVFTLREDGDSNLVTLISSTKIELDGVKVGDRVLLYYYPPQGLQYVSGNISVVSCIQIINGDIESKLAEDTSNWASDKVNMQKIWRTGQYLNIQCIGEIQSSPTAFTVAVDEETIDNVYPDVYVLFESDVNQSTTINAPTKTLYASYDISTVWNKSTCRGVNVHFNNYSGTETAKFEKSTLTILPTD